MCKYLSIHTFGFIWQLICFCSSLSCKCVCFWFKILWCVFFDDDVDTPCLLKIEKKKEKKKLEKTNEKSLYAATKELCWIFNFCVTRATAILRREIDEAGGGGRTRNCNFLWSFFKNKNGNGFGQFVRNLCLLYYFVRDKVNMFIS